MAHAQLTRFGLVDDYAAVAVETYLETLRAPARDPRSHRTLGRGGNISRRIVARAILDSDTLELRIPGSGPRRFVPLADLARVVMDYAPRAPLCRVVEVIVQASYTRDGAPVPIPELADACALAFARRFRGSGITGLPETYAESYPSAAPSTPSDYDPTLDPSLSDDDREFHAAIAKGEY